MRCSFIVVLSIAISFHALAQRPFITTWKTDNPGASEDNQITIPVFLNSLTYNYTVDWGDGSIDETVTGSITHTYATSGTYTVSITGQFPSISFGGRGTASPVDSEKILTVEQWGDISWETMVEAFKNCVNLTIPASDAPNLQNITSMDGIFEGASTFNESINHWDVSSITALRRIFIGASSYNQPLNNWDVSNVTSMSEMFRDASSFNQPIGSWNTENVIDMASMFRDATSFNQSLSSWNVGQVQNFRFTFRDAISFNQPLNDWNVSSATVMADMFVNCRSFNQPLSNWQVGNVTNMLSMFSGAEVFNQNIGSWDVSNVTNMAFMFDNASAFDQPLTDWDVRKVTNARRMFYNTPFNRPIGNWVFESLENMEQMFTNNPSFNQDISNWNVSKVTQMFALFENATSFNQPLDSWDVSSVQNLGGAFQNASSFDQSLANWDITNVTVNLTEIFDQSGMSIESYDATLKGWSELGTAPLGTVFTGAGLSYCTSVDARQDLIDSRGWTFTSDVNSCLSGFVRNIGIKENLEGRVQDFNLAISHGLEYEMTIISGNTSGLFQIQNNIDLVITEGLQPDFEDASLHFLTIRVDYVSNISTEEFQVIIEVEDVSEAPNIVDQSFQVNENSETGEVVGEVDAFDQDAGDQIEFSIVSGNEEGAFAIDPATGELTVNQSDLLDFEIEPIWGLVVEVTDLEGQTTQATITINLIDLAEVPFITQWKTDNVGVSSDNQISISTQGDGYLYSVDWGDGSSDHNLEGNVTHNYENVGVYTVSITGLFPRVYFGGGLDALKLISIDQWGDQRWTSMNQAFFGCENLELNAEDTPDLTVVESAGQMFEDAFLLNGSVSQWDVGNITDLKAMFRNAKAFNQPIDTWNVSNVTDMSFIFEGAETFDQSIDSWNVSKVTDMEGMFRRAISFNQPLENWDVSGVTQMQSMFSGAASFNMPIDSWDVSSVTGMNFMFSEAETFNQPLGSWNVAKVFNMENMFSGATNFDQPLANWDVGSVGVMQKMFRQATSFNQPLNSWNVSNVADMDEMFFIALSFDQPLTGWNVTNVQQMNDFFDSSGMSIANYEATIIGWSQLPSLFPNVTIGAAGMYYCTAGVERQNIIDNFNWVFSGDSPSCINANETTFSVNENLTNGSVIGTLDFSSVNDELITAELVSSTFRFEEATRELILIDSTALDFESQSSLDLDITLTNESLESRTLSVTIELIDVNETPFFLESQTTAANVDEIAIEGTFLTTLKADDPDFGDDLDFSIVGGNTGAAFRLEDSSNPQELVVNSSSALDFDLKPVFNLVVRVTDNAGLFDEIEISVSLNEVAKVPFITTWNTENPGSLGENTIRIPTVESETYFYAVDWGDGQTDEGLSGSTIHQYTDPGIYTVSITGRFPRLDFGGSNGGGKEKILSVEQWGDNPWASMEQAFEGCTNLVINAGDTPNLSGVSSMREMFRDASSVNSNIEDWNMSSVSDMSGLFLRAESFNQPVNGWDVGSVTDMSFMFSQAIAFNQSLADWDVSNVVDMSEMFTFANSFNQDLNGWDVSNVTNMEATFNNMTSFDQNLANWDVSGVTNMNRIFTFTKSLSIANYDATITGWAQLESLQPDVTVGSFDQSYCLSVEGRQKLIDDFGWVFDFDEFECFEEGNPAASLARSGAIGFSTTIGSFFGLGRNDEGYFNDFYQIDLAGEELELLSFFPGVPRTNASSFVINNKAYVGLGQDVEGNYLKDFYSYDPLTDTWTKLADFGGGERSDAIAISINGFGYVGTGINDVDEQKDFWRYDPASDTWTQMTDVPSDKRRGAFAFEIDGKGYVGGGFNFDGFSFQLSDIQEYDPETNTWTEKIFADGINLSVNNAATFSLYGNGYIAYGSKENLVKYNPITNEVKNLGDVFGLGDNRNDPVAFVSGDSAVFGLGSFSFFPTAYSNTFDFYFEENILPTNLSLDNLRMEENSAEMSLVGMLTVEDADEFKGHSFAFTAGGGTNNSDNTSFSITNNELFTNESFDFESKNMYQLNIEAIDSRGGKATMAFEVLVVDVNEEPTDIVLEERNLVEVDNDEQVFLVAGSLGTIDQDSGDSFVYSIVQGDGQNDTDNDRFRIDASQLSILAPNFEEKSNYSVNIQSQDQEGLTFVKSFNISVSDRNDTPTELLLSGREVVENAMPGTLIGSFTTVDEDEPDPSTFTYILQNDLPGQFEVQGSDLLVGAGLRGVSEDSEVFLVVLSQDPQGVQFFAEFSIKVLNEPEPLGVSKNVDILIYPNPVENTLKLGHDHLTNSDYQLQVLNVQGKVLLESSNSNELDVSELNSGTYILKLIIDGAVSSRKFLKN